MIEGVRKEKDKPPSPGGLGHFKSTRSHTVLFVVNDLNFLVSHRQRLVQRTLREGKKVCIASPEGRECEAFPGASYTHYRIPLSRWGMNPFSELYGLVYLAWLYLRVKPDLVHHIAIKPVVYGTLVARFLRVKAVVNTIPGLGHMFSGTGFIGAFKRLLATALYRLALKGSSSVTICQNPEDIDFFENTIGVSPKQMRLVPGSGVDTERFQAMPEKGGKPTVLMACRLLTKKGLKEFAEASYLLGERGVEARFVLIGTHSEQNPESISSADLESWIAKGLIEYHGHQADVLPWIEQSHIVCLPSYYREGLPRVLLEAAACERAILASNIPSISQMFTSGLNAILVPPKNAEMLASAVQLLLEDPELRRFLGSNARTTILEHGCCVDSVVSHIDSVHQRLLRA